MKKALKLGVPMLFVFLWLVTMLPCAFAKDITFRGRVIDSETKEPIEGAAVVAYWYEAMPTLAGEATRLKDVKETLTDKNGEWSISGEEGKPHTEHPYFHLITGIHYTRHPQFIVFKPGYCSWPEGFYIEACKDKIRSSGEFMTGKTYELPKLTDREDRIRAQSISIPAGEGALEKLGELIRLINEERRSLGLPPDLIYKKEQRR
jgi:hypothetical protein